MVAERAWLTPRVPDPPAGLIAMDRFDWERTIQRIALPIGARALAATLATFADPDGTRVRPGWQRLSNATGLSRASIARHMSVLRNGGLIWRTRQGNRHLLECDEYRLTIAEETVRVLPDIDPRGTVQVSPVSPRLPGWRASLGLTSDESGPQF